MQKKDKILATGFDFMNCAELHLNPNNIDNYAGESLYMSRQGYISPIWSRDLTLKLMETATSEHWKLLIHDCSNRTKSARARGRLVRRKQLWVRVPANSICGVHSDAGGRVHRL